MMPAFCLLFLIPACKSSAPVVENIAMPDDPAAPTEFQPLSSLSLIHLEEGRYPNLFSSGSYALWVDESVARAKLQKDAQDGIPVNAALSNDADYISANYLVFECRLESVFPDASIAYDVVGLRNIDIYLVTPGGGLVRPIQRILGTHADESQLGALRRFGRTNVLVFAKQDILAGTPTIRSDVEGVRMVVDGFNSTFYFEWAAAGTGRPPTAADGTKGRLGFSDLYSKLRVLARKFQ